MKISKALKHFLAYQEFNSNNTIQNYQYVLAIFQKQFGMREVTSDEIIRFLVKITEGLESSIK